MVQVCLYITFLTLDLLDRYGTISNQIKLLIVILCCIFVWSRRTSGICVKEEIYYVRLIQLGMMFTLIADLYIIVYNGNEMGVISFIVVQFIYGIMLIEGKLLTQKQLNVKTKVVVLQMIFRIFIQLVLSGVILFSLHALSVTVDLLLIVTVYYFISITFNMCSSIQLAYKSKQKVYVLYAIGMILFVLCDINVGIFNMAGFISIPQSVYQVVYPLASILMWVFYAPSQVIIGLSVNHICENTQKNQIKL